MRMAKYKEEAEEAAAAVRRCEPQAVVEVKRRGWFRRSWYVLVVRGRERFVYEDINHYWLESSLLAMLGKGRF